jgi:hypothetical protein
VNTQVTAANRPAAGGRSARSASAKVFWRSWAVLMLLASVWVIANPLMASPDEPAHVIKAASVVRGQMTGPDGKGGTEVEVPYFYNLTGAYPSCYMFWPDRTGVCKVRADQPLATTVVAVTPAGRYNPLYYAIVGVPTLFPPGDGALYAMRLISAALSTFLLALGLRALAEAGRRSWGVLGAAAALTPMVLFLSSTVNPAAIEIAAAFALWCQLLTLLRHPDASRTASRMAWVAVTVTFLVNSRGLSLLYCAVLVGVVLLVSPWRSFLEVVRTRSTWPSFAVIVVACVAAFGWVVGTNSLGSGGTVLDPNMTFLGAAKITLLNTDSYLTNMVGQFGWMDTNLKTSVHMTFAAALGVVVLLSFAAGTWRERAGLLVIAGLTLALPILIQSSQARYLGIIWQGRYIMPIAIGLPLLAGYVLVRRLAAVPRELGVALAGVVAAVVVLVQGAALMENLHRYVNGEAGGWLSLAPDAWLPPVPLGLVLVAALVAVVGYGVLLAWIARSDGDLARDLPAPAAGAAAPAAPTPRSAEPPRQGLTRDETPAASS